MSPIISHNHYHSGSYDVGENRTYYHVSRHYNSSRDDFCDSDILVIAGQRSLSRPDPTYTSKSLPSMIVPRRDKWRRRWQSAGMPPVLEFRKCRWQFYTLRSCLVFCSQLTTCISMEKCRRWTAGTVAATISNTPMPRWLAISFAIA